MKAILLVGGFGTRLRPLTLHRPKAILPILNVPFIYYQLSLLEKAGVRDVVLASGHLSSGLKNALRHYPSRRMSITHAEEKTPLGTGGAIRFAYDQLKRKGLSKNERIIVFNGDILFDLDLIRFVDRHERSGAQCSIAVRPVPDPSRFGLVVLDSRNQVLEFLEKSNKTNKGNLINAGAYLFNSDLLNTIPQRKPVSIERDVFPVWLKEAVKIEGFPFRGYWNDIGTPATYLQAHKDLLFNKNIWTTKSLLRKRGLSQRRKKGLVMGTKTKVGKRVSVSGMVCLGSRVIIEDDCSLKDCVVFDNVHVGRGARLSEAIIGANCVVGAFSRIDGGAVVGDGSLLTDYSNFSIPKR